MDRYLRGLIAGIIGGVAMNLWTVIKTHFEGFYALINQLTWVGLLGIAFSYSFPLTTSRSYLIYAIPVLLQTPVLSKHSLQTVLSNHTGGLIWGLTMAQVLRWLDTTPNWNKQ